MGGRQGDGFDSGGCKKYPLPCRRFWVHRRLRRALQGEGGWRAEKADATYQRPADDGGCRCWFGCEWWWYWCAWCAWCVLGVLSVCLVVVLAEASMASDERLVLTVSRSRCGYCWVVGGGGVGENMHGFRLQYTFCAEFGIVSWLVLPWIDLRCLAMPCLNH